MYVWGELEGTIYITLGQTIVKKTKQNKKKGGIGHSSTRDRMRGERKEISGPFQKMENIENSSLGT